MTLAKYFSEYHIKSASCEESMNAILILWSNHIFKTLFWCTEITLFTKSKLYLENMILIRYSSKYLQKCFWKRVLVPKTRSHSAFLFPFAFPFAFEMNALLVKEEKKRKEKIEQQLIWPPFKKTGRCVGGVKWTKNSK